MATIHTVLHLATQKSKNFLQQKMMRKNILLTAFLAGIFTASIAQPKKVVADKIVGIVGDKIVLKSDIDNQIADMQRQGIEAPPNARCLALQQAMGVKALVLQAEKDSLPITDEEIETDIDNQIRGFINNYGSKEELEKIAGRSIYQLKEDFREGFRDRKLATDMRNKIVGDVKITPNEVKNYFDKIPKDSLAYYESELELGQIVMYPKASRDAEEYAVQQLNDYKKQAESGKDFKSLAIINSDDPGVKQNYGQYEINRNQKDLDPTWLSKAFTLKDGQISTPFKSKFGYHIIKMISKNGDDAVVMHILKIPQVTQIEMKEGKDKMDSVRANLISGTIDFGTAVARYSDDDASKFTGGMIQGNNGGFLTIDQLDKDMIPLLQDLKPGQYSQPTEFTDQLGKKGIRIIYLKTRTEPHRENLKDDYSKIAQRALEEKKETALDDWFNKKINTYYIMVDDDYKNCDVMKKWVDAAKATGKQ